MNPPTKSGPRVRLAGIASVLLSIAPVSIADSERQEELAAFHRIVLSGNFAAIVRQAASPAWEISGPRAQQEQISAVVRNDALELEQAGGFLKTLDELEVTARIELLQWSELQAGHGIRVQASELALGDFTVDIDSGAVVRLEGRCAHLTAAVDAGAELDASALRCDRVTLEATTGATVRVFATEGITADSDLGAEVVVLGSPRERKVDTSLGGELRFDPE